MSESSAVRVRTGARRRGGAVLAAVALGLVGITPALGSSTTVDVLVVHGQGWGHGVGMAQDGALAMGREGADVHQILGHFYPGTSIGTGSGTVRVVVHEEASAVLSFPQGGEVRSPSSGQQHVGFPVSVQPGGSVRLHLHPGSHGVEPLAGATPHPSFQAAAGPTVSAAASTRPVVAALAGPEVEDPPPTTTTSTTTSTTTTRPPSTTTTTRPRPTTTTTTAPAPTTTTTTVPAPAPPPPSTVVTSPDSVWAMPANGGVVALADRGRQYRGSVEGRSDPARLVNHVDIEQYLRGMGEVRDPSWPAAALQAQAVAARTYALRQIAGGGELCDTQRCQVYLGQQAEYAAMDAAVSSTAGWVVLHRGGLASTVYSASAGGTSATPAEGFGGIDAAYPYLRAAAHPTADPMPWTREVALADVAARFGYRGTLERVTIGEAGPSDRALTVALHGSAGRAEVTAMEFQRGLALRSTLYDLRVDRADVAPPAPDPAELIQGLPDDGRQPDRPPVGLLRRTPAAATATPSTGPAGIVAGLAVLASAGGTAAMRRRLFLGPRRLGLHGRR